MPRVLEGSSRLCSGDTSSASVNVAFETVAGSNWTSRPTAQCPRLLMEVDSMQIKRRMSLT